MIHPALALLLSRFTVDKGDAGENFFTQQIESIKEMVNITKCFILCGYSEIKKKNWMSHAAKHILKSKVTEEELGVGGVKNKML